MLQRGRRKGEQGGELGPLSSSLPITPLNICSFPQCSPGGGGLSAGGAIKPLGILSLQQTSGHCACDLAGTESHTDSVYDKQVEPLRRMFACLGTSTPRNN